MLLPTKFPGGWEQNRPGRPLPSLCSDPGRTATAPWPDQPVAVSTREQGGPPDELSPLSPISPLSPRPRSSSKDREHRNPKNGAAAVCRRSTPPLTNRCWGKVRQDLFFVPAEPWFLGWRRFFVIAVFPRRHRPAFVFNSGHRRPSPTSPTLHASPG